MLKKTITYTDYDGNERTEDFYFNLSKAEAIEMQANASGGLEEFYRRIIAERDIPKIYQMFKDLVLKSYGKKSIDGKRFIKSPEMAEEFSQTEAFSELIMEIMTNPEEASTFANGIVSSIGKGHAVPEIAK